MHLAFPDVDVAQSSGNPRGYDVVVNGTSLGLSASDLLPVDPELLEAKTAVIDVIAAREPEIIQIARARGCRVVNGLAMMQGQVEAMTAFLRDR